MATVLYCLLDTVNLIMETFNLLEKYLKENVSYEDTTLNDFEINGSIIKLRYSYNPNYDWQKDYVSYDNVMEVQLLDYMTWIYNQCFNIKRYKTNFIIIIIGVFELWNRVTHELKCFCFFSLFQ